MSGLYLGGHGKKQLKISNIIQVEISLHHVEINCSLVNEKIYKIVMYYHIVALMHTLDMIIIKRQDTMFQGINYCNPTLTLRLKSGAI